MRVLLLIALFMFNFLVQAKELTVRESETLTAEVKAIITSFNKGDVTLFVEKAHPSIIKYMGGKDAFEKAMKEKADKLQLKQMESADIECGRPSELYDAGEEEICIIPIYETKKTQLAILNTNYVIAVRKVADKKWKYLNGDSSNIGKELLLKLMPKLKKDIKLPKARKFVFKSKEIKPSTLKGLTIVVEQFDSYKSNFDRGMKIDAIERQKKNQEQLEELKPQPQEPLDKLGKGSCRKN